MINQIRYFFHIAIIALFIIGCGYKAPPYWEDNQLKILEINSTK